MSTIYVVERIYDDTELLIKAFRIESEAKGHKAELCKIWPGQKFRVQELELVED